MIQHQKGLQQGRNPRSGLCVPDGPFDRPEDEGIVSSLPPTTLRLPSYSDRHPCAMGFDA
ncbi:hypothetical protein ABHI18_005161 [Aspergillus niger]